MAKNFKIDIDKMEDGYMLTITSTILTKTLAFSKLLQELDDQTIQTAYYEALATWEYDVGIGQEDHPSALTKAEILMDLQLHNLVGNNWIRVHPFVWTDVREKEMQLTEPDPWFKDALKDVDVMRFSGFDREFLDQFVFLDTATEGIPPLSALVLRRMSLFNYTQRDSEGKLVVSSTSNLRPYKVPTLIQKYAKDVHLSLDDVFIKRCICEGVNILSSIMNVRRFFGTVNFVYSVDQLAKTAYPGESSSGLRMGRGSRTVENGLTVVAAVNGPKREQAPYAFAAVDSYVEMIRRGILPHYPEICCKIAFKYEIVDCMWSFGPKRRAKYMKCREFFIPHFTDFIISNMVFGFKTLVERGNTICVGLKWWGGGAHQFVTELGYGRKDIIYASGDIKGQDYTTPHYMLQLFVASALAYISPSSPDYDLFCYMLRQAGDHLVAKLVRFTGNMWRWVVGTMPSGHYVTSHGNSWILAVYFWAYVYGVHIRNPRAKLLVRIGKDWSVGKQYFIRFKVYGDNHVMAINKEASKYLSYMDFVSFVAGMGITIHDIQDNVPLLSVKDHMGGLATTGIVFLKRYFVEVKLGATTMVLPYKRMIDIAPKIVYGNSVRRNEFDLALALSGLAWDTMGTNGPALTAIKHLYIVTMRRITNSGLDAWKRYMETYVASEDLKKRARKIGIPLEDYYRFPTQRELLQRHSPDEDQYKYRKLPCREGCIWVDDLIGETYLNEYPFN